ncbi:Uncharacterised protein [Helicobacter fennelliae]|uniref:DUF3972 domain-containing protein n=2 Tax=Helicobacter fennelliae TaxID=215 RepID=T1CNP2_9HELI|nr:DUF3972 domain-containing protein [Helicobacter fennelliae]GAD18399.1 hypothetical protein HFN_2327 [Helicobacter fennelliae MRY12-0050]SQB98282.1 Uncharacterised protein [Helicobacter fennelliae]STP14371.1 Uncharacterised protein [Helicobacter fennelliae]STQ84497.1 Uncharacterised protein [Helicobacter fennelliae]
MENKNSAWVAFDEFLKISGLEEQRVNEMIANGSIKSKEENGEIYIEAESSTNALISRVQTGLTSAEANGQVYDPVFVERTIHTIMGLHEKVVMAKDETIAAFKNENGFLKEALISMQEVYDDDKKTIDTMREELKHAREELEFMKRKYRLMWGRVSDLGGSNTGGNNTGGSGTGGSQT